MSVYRPRKSPYWHFDFVLQGRRFHGSTGTKEKPIAKAVEKAERERAIKALRLGERPQYSTNQTFGRFFREVARYEAGTDTVHRQIANMLAIIGQDTLLSELDDNRVTELVARLRNGRANATVNRHVQLLRRIWKRAAQLWRAAVGDEPLWSEHLLEEAEERHRELTAEEEERLFEELRPDYRDLMRFALLTGMRLKNLIRLTWKQVDESAGVITIRVKSRKPGGRENRIPITPAMAEIVQRNRKLHPLFVFTYRCRRPHGTLRRRGERYPFSHDGWRRAWADALKKAKIEDFRFHDFRHTAGSRALRGSGNMKAVQKMLGHADMRSTARYAHVHDEDVRQAMEAAIPRNSPGVVSADKQKKKAGSAA